MLIKDILSNPHELNWIESLSYKSMIDKKWIQDHYQFSEKSAERLIKELKLTHVQGRLINLAKEYEGGLSPKKLAATYGISNTAVTQFLKRHGIKIRQSRFFADFNFFENIDSEEKAYILGFIYADGCVHKKSLIISLHERDLEILERFKSCLNAEHNILLRKKIVRFTVCDQKLVDDLERCGVEPRKTETIKMPDLSGELLRHFIRGYFDGDGSFSFYTTFRGHKKYTCGLLAPIDFCESIRSVLQKELGIPASAKLKQRHKKSLTLVRALEMNGRLQTLKVLDWLYSDASIYLDRKYVKYLNIPR